LGRDLDTVTPGAGGVTTASEGRMERVVIGKLTWRLVPFLFLLYIVAYLDRINVGFAALQMQPRLHLNDAQYGLGSGICFFVGYFLFQVPSNLVLQRVGAKRWIAVLMMIWGVISSAMIFVTSVRSFYTVRFLLGAAEAGFYPGVIFYLRSWFPLSARARTVARFMTAAPLSGVVGGPISGVLLNLQGRLGMAGWQWLFLMEGLPAILLGGVVMVYLTNRAEDAHWLTEEQRTWLLDRLGREQTGSVAGEGSGKFAAFGIAGVWALAFVYFGLNTVSYGMSMWLPNLIHSLSGVGNVVIGLLSAIPYLAAVLVMMWVGLHSDRTGERRWHIAVPAFAGAAALGVAAYSHSMVLSIVAFSVAVLGVFSMVAPVWALATGRLSGAAAAVGIALINSVGNLGGGFGPYIIGFIRNLTGTFQGGLLVVGAVLGSAGVMALLVRPEARRETV
jgi:ACS family tartrate transporter-like MFS transporter